MANKRSLWLAATAVVFGVTLAACSSPGGGANPTGGGPNSSVAGSTSSAGAAGPTGPAFTAAAGQCPTAAKVGKALGITLPKPTAVSGGGGKPLPGGATGVVCDYHAATYNVIIEILSNVDPSYISQFSSEFPVAYSSVSGVGDQARSFSQSLGGGKDNEGLVATKGKTLVDIVATDTPASLSQLGDLANQLL